MFAVIDENPVQWLEKYGDYLFAFAVSRLHNEAVAEDLVQETLLAAIESHKNFSGDSSVKTWLTAILRHKIIDYYRRASRQVSFAETGSETDKEFFDESGNWRESAAPSGWQKSPESLLELKEFQTVLRECLSALPQNLSAVFTLREIEGLGTKEICEILTLSPNNFWVLLHRARLRLRQDVERRWFGNAGKEFKPACDALFQIGLQAEI